MGDTRTRRGAANLAPILMIVSVLAMAGLLVWLGATAEGTQPVVVQTDDNAVDSLELMATGISRDQLRSQTSDYIGQFVRLSGVQVIQSIGSEAFLVEIGTAAGSSPFLVKLDSALVAQGQMLPTGSVSVLGTVTEMSDSAMDAWTARNVISGGDRALLEFMSNFIQASLIR